MKRYLIAIVVVLVVATASGVGYATSVGVSMGFDPTGVVMANVLATVGVGNMINLRAELGLSTFSVSGLMLLDGMALIHYPIDVANPFAGVGIGGAFTRAGTNAFTVEGVLGTDIALFPPMSTFIDVRYIVRFTPYGIDAGPLFEAGVAFNF